MDKLLYGEDEARERLGNIGHSLFYKLISSGQLESVSIGKRRLVPADALEKFVTMLRTKGLDKNQKMWWLTKNEVRL